MHKILLKQSPTVAKIVQIGIITGFTVPDNK